MDPMQPPVYAPQPVLAVPTTTSINVVPPAPPRQPGNRNGMIVTGAMQLMCAILALSFGITLATYVEILTYTWNRFGLGCASMFFIAGGLGIACHSRTYRSRCLVVSYMIMSIFACLAAVALGFYAMVYMFVGDVLLGCYQYDDLDIFNQIYGHTIRSEEQCHMARVSMALNGCLVALAFIEFFVSIIGASMTCSGLCGGGGGFTTQQVVVQMQTGQPGPVYYPPAPNQPQLVPGAYGIQQPTGASALGPYPQEAFGQPPQYPQTQDMKAKLIDG